MATTKAKNKNTKMIEQYGRKVVRKAKKASTSQGKKKHFFIGETMIPAKVCEQPIMSDVKGHDWKVTGATINGKQVPSFYDADRGVYMYFLLNKVWYKVRLQPTALDVERGKRDYKINPNKPKITMK